MRTLRVAAVLYHAREHDVVVQGCDADIRCRHIATDHRRKIGDIALDTNVDRENLMALGVEKECVRLPGLLCKQEDPARCADDGIHHSRIGNKNVARIGVELHKRSLVERQRNVLLRSRPTMRCHIDDARGGRFSARKRRCRTQCDGGENRKKPPQHGFYSPPKSTPRVMP